MKFITYNNFGPIVSQVRMLTQVTKKKISPKAYGIIEYTDPKFYLKDKNDGHFNMNNI